MLSASMDLADPACPYIVLIVSSAFIIFTPSKECPSARDAGGMDPQTPYDSHMRKSPHRSGLRIIYAFTATS